MIAIAECVPFQLPDRYVYFERSSSCQLGLHRMSSNRSSYALVFEIRVFTFCVTMMT